MSRVFGKAFDVYNVAKELKETKFERYKRDNRECSWTDIEQTPEKIEIYLPDRAIDFLSSKKTKIIKTPFNRYTNMQIPGKENEERYIRFPSLLPKIEFKRELIYYMGMLLSSYREDDLSEDLGIREEYEDVLPLILEYLYLKSVGEEDKFSIKHLNEMKKFTKEYMTFYDDYQDFSDLRRTANLSSLDEKRYQNFQQLCIDKDTEITSFTHDCITQLSSMEAALSIIDSIKDIEDIKKIIEELMLNEKGNRSHVLIEREINSYGYRRLRKEIETYRKK